MVSSVIFQIHAYLCIVNVSHTKLSRENVHRKNDRKNMGRTNIH